MTAEIAILNKYGIALAADSAVTISAGEKEEKIFDSADKLFELTCHNPIALMVFSQSNFADIPIQILINKFRSEGRVYATVREAADDFFVFLNTYAASAPEAVQRSAIIRSLGPLVSEMSKRIESKISDGVNRFFEGDEPPKPYDVLVKSSVDEVISLFIRVSKKIRPAKFVGEDGAVAPDDIAKKTIDHLIKTHLPQADRGQKQRIKKLISSYLKSDFFFNSSMGIVVAGYGRDELFPTLIHFDVSGFVSGRLRYAERQFIDIDRNGVRARVIPFAQKEMVERFLYGLDGRIEREVAAFASSAVSDISAAILDQLDFADDAARERTEVAAAAAEKAFSDGLKSRAFAAIRKKSQAEIEDMVEFMPKPELARMAEALVNLTSIKRRVSRGMETVGGPIDVAMISQSEGLVWVKRKHYFPSDLNPRYHERVRSMMAHVAEGKNV